MDLKRQVVTGMFWRSSGRIVNQVVQLGISMVLARLLTPEDYGIVAMATVFLTLAGVFGEFGLAAALVQRKAVTAIHMDSVFWASLAIGVAIAALLWSVAPWVSAFYREPILADVFPVLALSFALAPLGVVQRALLTREMAFRSLALVEIGTTFATGFLAIALALNGLGVWSLVWSSVLGKLVTYGLLNFFRHWRPNFAFELGALRDLLSFGTSLTAHSLITFINGAVDRLIIGKAMGAQSVGIYGRAYALMLTPFTQIVWALTFVLFPALSSIQNDKDKVRSIYLRALSVLFFITAPLLLGMIAVADAFIPVVFGDQWINAVPILRVFCLLGLLQVVTHLLGPVINSQGHPGLLVKFGILQSAFMLVGVSIGASMDNLTLVALGIIVAEALCFPLWIKYAGGLVGVEFRDIWKAINTSLISAAFMASVVWLGRKYLFNDATLIYMLISIGIGLGVYVSLAWIVKSPAWLEIGTIIKTIRPKKIIDA